MTDVSRETSAPHNAQERRGLAIRDAASGAAVAMQITGSPSPKPEALPSCPPAGGGSNWERLGGPVRAGRTNARRIRVFRSRGEAERVALAPMAAGG